MAKILVVDDDPDIVEALKITLEANSYEVCSASNGTEGLEMVKSENPDLIILDVMMDSQTEGFQVSYQLKSTDPDSEYAKYSKIPIIMLTAIHEHTKSRFSLDKDGDYLPVEEFIEKPVQPKELLDKMKKLLRK